MSNQIVYENLALDWSPTGKTDYRFISIALASLVAMLVFGIFLSSVQISETKREVTVIPDRIANLILEQEKLKPVVIPEEKPLPKPEPKPEPEIEEKPEEKPEESIKKPRKEIEKAVTKEQQDARDRAKQTGLLALGSELADLMETASVTNAVSGKITDQQAESSVSSTVNTELLTEGVNKGSSQGASKKYTNTVSTSTKLTARQMQEIDQRLVSQERLNSSATESEKNGNANVNSRGEEEITLVFDQNKSKLYSIYNRERRKNPNLKGKVVLEIVISPEGKVLSVKILSSELNLPKLERSLVSRVKQFKFSSGKSKPITITYPIEFLP